MDESGLSSRLGLTLKIYWYNSRQSEKILYAFMRG